MSEGRRAVITVWEDGDTDIEFFPEVSNGMAFYEALGWIGFFAIAKANREREELDDEGQGERT